MSKTKAILILGLLFAAICCSCATGPDRVEAPAVIAVWDLEDLSYEGGVYPMGEMLSSKIIESIAEDGRYSIVERQRLLIILEELNIGSSGLADEETRLRVGKMAGAGRMIFGGYQVVGDLMRIDLRLVDVSTGKIVKAVQKTTQASSLTGWADAAAEAAEELL